MKITLLCNCGLALESGGRTLLVDALTKPLAPFYHTPPAVRADILNGAGAFKNICGMVFTHLHPDHFDREAAEEFSARHPNIPLYIPRRAIATETLQAGDFSITCRRARHTKVEGYGKSTVETLRIEAEGKRIYIASDCAPESSIHEAILEGKVMDAAFWNPEALCLPEMWPLLTRCARQNFIYHIPPDGQNGLCRKLARVMARGEDALSNVQLLSQYPSEIVL